MPTRLLCLTVVCLAAGCAVAPADPGRGRALARIAFGSCANQDKPMAIWGTIADARPDLYIALGDNIYADTRDMTVMKAKYDKLAADPGWARLRAACPVMATWDDHDYGLNDGGADFPARAESQRVFCDFFGDPPDSPRRSRPGVYDARVFGPEGRRVQVILLDTRYFRSPLRRKTPKPPKGVGPYEAETDPAATMLGDAQWKWLEQQLRVPAELRLIASSVQVISEDHGWEKWMNFPAERDRLFRLIADTKAAGVVFLSGDRHLAELSMMDGGVGYPLYDVTASGLNQADKAWRPMEANRRRVAGMNFDDHFGMVTVDWERPDPARSGRAVPIDGLVGRISGLGARRAARLGIPVVNLHFSSACRDRLPGVFPDFAECGRQRAEHLLVRGFRRFGVLAHASGRAAMLEADSFERTVRAAGGAGVPRLVLPAARVRSRLGVGDCDLADYSEWLRAMRRIDAWIAGRQPPIGLFVYDVALARVVIQKCQSRGLRVPDDVAVIAGWNEEIQCDCVEPTITSLELPYERIGWEAARMLDDRIARSRSRDADDRDAPPTALLLPPVGIVERQSTDFHAVKDDLVRRALAYIGVHLRRAIRIDEVARHLEVSRVTLTSRFRRAIGRSVNDEVRRLRVERAKRELAGSEAPVGAVAASAGFGSVRNLNKIFRAEVGCTPTDYRLAERPRR